jgi:hypothetical protein
MSPATVDAYAIRIHELHHNLREHHRHYRRGAQIRTGPLGLRRHLRDAEHLHPRPARQAGTGSQENRGGDCLAGWHQKGRVLTRPFLSAIRFSCKLHKDKRPTSGLEPLSSTPATSLLEHVRCSNKTPSTPPGASSVSTFYLQNGLFFE